MPNQGTPDRQRAHLAGLQVLRHLRNRFGYELHLSGQQVGKRGRGAFEGHMHHIASGGLLKRFGHQMRNTATACRAVIYLARIFPRIADALGKRLDRHIVFHYQRQRLLRSALDRCEIAQGDLGVLDVDKWVNDHSARIGHQQGVAVSWCLHDEVRTDGRASTRLVIDDYRLAEVFLQLID